jgi:hypothetical protein
MEESLKRKKIDDSYYRQIFYLEAGETAKNLDAILYHMFFEKKISEKQKVLAYRFAYEIVDLDNSPNFWISSTKYVQWDSTNAKEMSNYPKVCFDWYSEEQKLVMTNMQITFDEKPARDQISGELLKRGNTKLRNKEDQFLVPRDDLVVFANRLCSWLVCQMPDTDDSGNRRFVNDYGEGFGYVQHSDTWSHKIDSHFDKEVAIEIIFLTHCFISQYHDDLVFFISDFGTFDNTRKYFINSCMTCGNLESLKHEKNDRSKIFCSKSCQKIHYQ